MPQRRKWNNGQIEKTCVESPGPDYVLGRLPEVANNENRKQAVKDRIAGSTAWNDGVKNYYLKTGGTPEPNWVKGLMPYTKKEKPKPPPKPLREITDLVTVFNETVENKLGRLNSRALRWDYIFKKELSLEQFIDQNKYEDVQDCYYKLNMNLEEFPLCPTCKTNHRKPSKGTSGNFILSSYCSVECSNGDFEARSKIGRTIQASVDQVAADEKRRQTMIEKYGVAYNGQRDEVKESIAVSNRTPEKKQKLSIALKEFNSHIPYEDITIEKVLEMNKTLSVPSIAREFGTSVTFIHQFFARHGEKVNKEIYSSYPEKVLKDFLIEEGIEFEGNTRSIIRGELDIYIPSKKIAFEVDGVYWHSDLSGDKDSKGHIRKTDECQEQDIELLHFYDIHILQKTDIVKSIIRRKLGLPLQVIDSKDCVLEMVTNEEAKEFLDNNHLKGYCEGIHKGLFYKNELMSMITLYGKKMLRYCDRIDTKCNCGLEKLCSDETRMIIHSFDRKYGFGQEFLQAGFICHDKIPENYIWYKDGELYQRSSNDEKYESEGYGKLWDSGHYLFTFQ